MLGIFRWLELAKVVNVGYSMGAFWWSALVDWGLRFCSTWQQLALAV
jgi:hypothetical protein